jgi:hypothetical protein
MTPKEKAVELFDKMIFNQAISTKINCPNLANEYAKDCALIAVDEIIKSIVITDLTTAEYQFNYWEKVKQEIEKL